MTCEFEGTAPTGPIYRLGYRPDAWSWPPHDRIGRGRWDDPRGVYRVLYASSNRLATFLETMAEFRPDHEAEAQLLLIDVASDDTEIGRVPSDWLPRRALGQGNASHGWFARVAHSRSIGAIRKHLQGFLSILRINLDAGTMRVKDDLPLTQRVSRLVYECEESNGNRQFAGISHASRHGDELANWAIFEPFEIRERTSSSVGVTDADFVEAARRLGLGLPESVS
jgi:hypothetical protein